MTEPLLVTIGPSHYCEKARWALDHAGVAFREEAHVPIVHMAYTLGRTGRRHRSVPLLLAGDEVLASSNDILRFADRALPEGRRLFPEGGLGAEVEGLVRRFDDELGPATRRHAYCQLVDHPVAFGALFLGTPEHPVRGLAARERALVRVGNPVLRAAMRRIFKTSPRAAERTFTATRGIFDEVAERLRDGRRYLAGDRFTAADLTFAALADPLLGFLPPESLWHLLPPAFAEAMTELRAHPAGQFSQRLWAEERRRPHAPPVAGRG